jgi:acyl-CoA hydrolase
MMVTSSIPSPLVEAIDEVVKPGSTIALGDGSGAPTELLAPLSAAARSAGDVRLVLGFATVAHDGLEFDAFGDVVAMLGGYANRKPIDAGQARYVPARLGTWPALLHSAIKPDVLIASVVKYDDGYRFSSESCWMWPVIEGGARVVAIELTGPRCVAGPALPADRLTIVDKLDRGPARFSWTAPTDDHRVIAEQIARLIPDGARLQFAPGALGSAVVDALTKPVTPDTGILTEAVVALDERGLLAGTPVSGYAVGSDAIFDWIDGRQVLERAEITHGAGRLRADPPLVAVNTALEIDLDGQVNVESSRGSAVAGIGGQPDYMAGACASPTGLSILAIATGHFGRSTLVEALSAPTSTASHDIDVIVTERGMVDLRGKSRSERRTAIAHLWG